MFIRPGNWTDAVEQPLGRPAEPLRRRLDYGATLWRRCAFLLLVGGTVFFGLSMMVDILGANGVTVTEALILLLFSITFTWITVAFWIAAAGFICRMLDRDANTLTQRTFSADPDPGKISTRTAIIMPIYNEEPARVFAGIEAVYRSLARNGGSEAFDFYILSDTRDPDIAAREEAGWRGLCQDLGADGRLFYRRREDNTGRKASNIADFCRRWGRYYEHMIVLDADSIMTGDALVSLVRTMESHPDAAIIQAVPFPVRQDTLFGRFHQFAARVHSPLLATGLSFWQRHDCNYWGHNAILRTAAFTAHCGLPELPGRPPLGGEILSHDFVEAAFLRRGNWKVYLAPELKGSYEEMPGNLLDYAKRDQRWAQGNLQHLKLLMTKGLKPVSRMHFLFGALAYGSSLIWLGLLGLTTIDAFLRATTRHEFFGSGPQLFPNWPVVQTEAIVSLLLVTVLLLGLPKLAGILAVLNEPEEREAFGGGRRFAISAIAEIAFSILIAPIMMGFHAFFVVTTLAGRVVGWTPQNRTAEALSIREAVPPLIVPTLLGLAWGTVTYIWTPSLFWWLSPVTMGLTLSIPLTLISSRPEFGAWCRDRGFLLTPEETNPPSELQLTANRYGVDEAEGLTATDGAMAEAMPREITTDMPIQSIERWRFPARPKPRLRPFPKFRFDP